MQRESARDLYYSTSHPVLIWSVWLRFTRSEPTPHHVSTTACCPENPIKRSPLSGLLCRMQSWSGCKGGASGIQVIGQVIWSGPDLTGLHSLDLTAHKELSGVNKRVSYTTSLRSTTTGSCIPLSLQEAQTKVYCSYSLTSFTSILIPRRLMKALIWFTLSLTSLPNFALHIHGRYSCHSYCTPSEDTKQCSQTGRPKTKKDNMSHRFSNNYTGFRFKHALTTNLQHLLFDTLMVLCLSISLQG